MQHIGFNRLSMGFSIAAHRFLSVVGACAIAILLGAVMPSVIDSSVAGELKLDAPCAQLQPTDVTTVDNPSCPAVSAIYFDKDGNSIYSERLELNGERQVTGRIVKVNPGCAEGDRDCAGGCSSLRCSKCSGGRCFCIC